MSKEFSVKRDQLQVGAMIGVDYIVLEKLSYSPEQCGIDYRVVNTRSGAVELAQVIPFRTGELETCVETVSAPIRTAVIKLLAQKNKQTFVSIVNFKNRSPLRRTDWLETAIPSQLQTTFGHLTNVYVIEREDLDLLLQETRLARGGLTRPKQDGTVDETTSRYLLVEGEIHERQPKGQPLLTHVAVRVTDQLTGNSRTIPLEFPATEVARGLGTLCSVVAKRVGGNEEFGDARSVDPALETAEFEALLADVFHLMGENVPDSIRTGKRSAWPGGAASGWGHVFSPSDNPFDESSARRVAILRAIRCLKRALILRGDDSYVKSLLSVLLVDRQVGDYRLARDLALEVAGQYPNKEYQRDAWWFLIKSMNLPLEQLEYYLDLITVSYPGTSAARSSIAHYLNQARVKYEHQEFSRVDPAHI